jgi:cytochrome c oxidase subunit II
MNARIGAAVSVYAVATFTGFQKALAFEGVPRPWQIDLPQAATPVMEYMRGFNTLLLVIVIAIVTFVTGLLLWVMIRYRESANPVPSKLSHNSTIEVLWTIVPVLILVVIAIPSFRILFRQFDYPKPDVVVKATGRLWYWTYEYPDEKVTFDSNIIGDKDLKPGQLRNLAVDNEMVVPVNKVVQVLTTGGEVIHQWAVPAFGSRVDAMPGRINRTWFKVTETGTYYGQCSALCGQGHPYMPIAVKVVSEDEYRKWLAEKQQKTAAAEPARLALGDAGGGEKR